MHTKNTLISKFLLNFRYLTKVQKTLKFILFFTFLKQKKSPES